MAAHQGTRDTRGAGDHSVKEHVARHLRRLIQRGQLRAGDRLPTERELAAELGVSRPSVRAALQSLAAVGVVKSRRRAGTFLQQGTPVFDSQPLAMLAALHDFTSAQMFEARNVLEVLAAGLAARRATAEQRLAMAEAVAGMFASFDDPQAFLRFDIRFHRAVAAGADNPVLATLVDMASTLLYERRRSTITRARDLRDAAMEHQAIYDAIAKRRPAAARRSMNDHLRRALDGWMAEEAAAGGGQHVDARRPRARRRGAGQPPSPEGSVELP
jgi:GntR family transcriptional repressor for pyruvate dehydrogenase complex